MRRYGLALFTLAAVVFPAAVRATDGAAPKAGESAQPVVIYTKDRAPATPKLEDLPLKESVSRDGITWTFEKAVRCGQFVNGDWYVVGPATVVKIDPTPLYNDEIKDPTDKEKNLFKGNSVRNGSMLNPPARLQKSAFDSRIRGSSWFDPKLILHLPIAMKPGDALMSSISKAKTGEYVVKSYSVLTCLKEPVPADAFRPGYCDREQVIYLARNLKRDILPKLAVPPPNPKGESKSPSFPPSIPTMEDMFARPWYHEAFLEDAEAEYQFGGYGRSICQWVTNATLTLCLDLKPEAKERLLLNLVGHGLDLWGMAKSDGFTGWATMGGWGSGRKWPIVFAGVMLGDDKMASPTKTFPQLRFQEDNQTHYDDCWTGAGVVWAGHLGWGCFEKARPELSLGPYENVHPTRWNGWTGTSYRTNMTSSTWIGEAMAIHLLHAEKEWNADPFLDYCDRWMYEPDPAYGNGGYVSLQGHGWDPFAEAMWLAYREKLPSIAGRDSSPRPTTNWQKKRELKGPAVEIGKNRELLVKGKPFLPILIFA